MDETRVSLSPLTVTTRSCAAGLVGGVVLPLLGAVPDGAIILFSGLGDYETAQETLSVGVGALAGSTIMLLTVYVYHVAMHNIG